MSMYKNLTTICAAAALALGLAACGGGGGGGNGDTGMNGGGQPPAPPPPANLTALFGAAQTAITNAENAVAAAEEAETDAVDSAKMLTTTEVGGDSAKAMMSAQAILAARDAAAKAVTDAEAALAAAEKAETDAMAIADDHPQKSALMAAVDAAIEEAEASVKMATATRDGTKLKNAVAEVTGANKKGTPRSVANTVGGHIQAALMHTDTSPQRTGTRIADHVNTGVPAAVAAALKHSANDAQGMTWAMIVGEDNVMKMRLGTIASDTGVLTTGNEEVSVASIAGMTATDVTATTLTDGTIDADGGSTPGSYMGITGAVVCLGGSDGCKVTDGKLGAGWYFSPAMPKAYYQSQADDTSTDADESMLYEAETLYASYGYWLVDAGAATPNDATDDNVWTIHTSSSSLADNSNVDVSTVGTPANELEDSATYSGSAAGISVRTMGSGTSKTTDSGMFTADVMLEAKFGATTALEGTINNFQGDAVGAGWSVKLHSSAIDGTAFTAGDDATAGGRTGVWSATMYGSTAAAARPSGVHGGFVAHFADGDAAGAFAARKD